MKSVSVIGAGPAGLMAAEHLSAAGAAVHVFDRMPTPARKFLMAGRGGLNLTHSEDASSFHARYHEAQNFLEPALRTFTPQDVVAWCEGLGQPTFTGTSGRVFPKTFKASPLLRAWLARLQAQGVQFHFNENWDGWTQDGKLKFISRQFKTDATLLALGGASWPRLGGTGDWADLLRDKGIEVKPFSPANCGLVMNWTPIFSKKFAGHPLKSITLTHDGKAVAGELMITAKGLEGTPAYTLSPQLRVNTSAPITLDLKPGLSADALQGKLSVPRKRQSLSTFLQKQAGLTPEAIGCLYEMQAQGTVIPEEAAALARTIKSVPLKVASVAGIERAISSAGGIALHEVGADYELKKLPGIFVAGEMLDWEAPTGGYLLQACFSTGVAAAQGILKKLA